MLVQSAFLTDECEIIIMSSLCLNKTNTGKKGRGGEESKQNLKMKLHSHKLCVEDTVDMTVSVRSTEIRSYLTSAVVVRDASQTFLWLATRHSTVIAWPQFRVFEEKLVTANQVAENELSCCSVIPALFTRW